MLQATKAVTYTIISTWCHDTNKTHWSRGLSQKVYFKIKLYPISSQKLKKKERSTMISCHHSSLHTPNFSLLFGTSYEETKLLAKWSRLKKNYSHSVKEKLILTCGHLN